MEGKYYRPKAVQELVSMSVYLSRSTGSGTRGKKEGWRAVVKTALVKLVWLGA